MVSTRRKRQSTRRLLSQLDDFDRDIKIETAASDRQQNVVVNEGTVNQEFIDNNTGSQFDNQWDFVESADLGKML